MSNWPESNRHCHRLHFVRSHGSKRRVYYPEWPLLLSTARVVFPSLSHLELSQWPDQTSRTLILSFSKKRSSVWKLPSQHLQHSLWNSSTSYGSLSTGSLLSLLKSQSGCVSWSSHRLEFFLTKFKNSISKIFWRFSNDFCKGTCLCILWIQFDLC